MTWDECIAHWLASIERRSGSRHSVRAYRGDVARFAAWHRGEWAEVSAETAQRFVGALAETALRPATINRTVMTLRSLFRFAAEETGRAPLWSCPNPWGSRTLTQRVTRQVQMPSTSQVTRLLGAIDRTTTVGLRDYALFAGLFTTSRRLAEWLQVRWGDIHQTAQGWWVAYVGKGNRPGRQALTPATCAAVEAYLRAAGHWPPAADDYVFVRLRPAASWKRPLAAGYVYRRLRRLGLLAGQPWRVSHPHGLRHAGARRHRKAGADVWQLRELLHHSSLATTQIYTENVLDEPEPDPFAASVDAVLPQLTAR